MYFSVLRMVFRISLPVFLHLFCFFLLQLLSPHLSISGQVSKIFNT